MPEAQRHPLLVDGFRVFEWVPGDPIVDPLPAGQPQPPSIHPPQPIAPSVDEGAALGEVDGMAENEVNDIIVNDDDNTNDENDEDNFILDDESDINDDDNGSDNNNDYDDDENYNISYAPNSEEDTNGDADLSYDDTKDEDEKATNENNSNKVEHNTEEPLDDTSGHNNQLML